MKFCYICLQYTSSTEAWGLRKAILKKKLLDTGYESNIYINTVFEYYVSLENIYVLIWYYVVNNYEARSNSSQIVEQIELNKEVVYPAAFNLND